MLEQVTWRGGGVCCLGDVQKLSGHNPEQHALGGPCLSREVGQNDLSGPFQP